MVKLVKYLKPYLKQVTLGPAFKLLEAILELTIPLLMARLIDNGVRANDTSYIYRTGALMLAIAIVGAGSAYICQYYASIASQGFGTTMRNMLFKKVQSFSFSELDQIGTSSLINRITSDINQLQYGVAMLIRLVIRVPFLCIGGIIMAMLLNLKLSLVILVTMPLFAMVLYFIMSRTVPVYKSVQKKLDQLALIIRENLSGVRVIRAFARMEKERERFAKSNREYADTAVRVGKVSALLNPATLVIINFGIAAVLWFGGIQVNSGSMTQGEIIAYINYINMILSALIVLAGLVVTFTKTAASAARVNEILAMVPSVKDSISCISAGKTEEGKPIIEFERVYFSYNNSQDYALKDISIKIYQGQTIGIIGSTGSGKTTFINLIARFYDTSEGKIYVDGINVKEFEQAELRSKIGMVPQKSVLFSGTIEENLSLGNENATTEEIIEAARVAQAYGFIEKCPDGLKTRIFQGGINLSGGQKQRLAIARALVKKPEILIFDDSSSALDYVTDAALRRALKETMQDTTVLMVTQRVSTIKNADMIIVLEDGAIAGVGTNEQLFQNCSVYQEIYNSQEEEVVHP